ncbi:MAG: class I SAM-dependent methyltransferase [Desulfovibrio sp.]|nr:class I SAM-dependent methyltransferase [Desulfovibrio sp.]
MLPPSPPDKRLKKDKDQALFACQAALLREALASWPRRGAPILEANCGDGAFLPLLWRLGFDVVATEPDAEYRRAAAAQPAPGLEIYAASDDSLPFDNDYFDWVIVHLRKTAPDSDKNAIEEGLRVARRGLMVSFWNTASFASCFGLCRQKSSARDGWAWFRVWRRLLSLRAGSLSSFSAVYVPPMAWRDKTALSLTNRLAFLKIFGGWCLIRLDLDAPETATPLALKIERELPGGSPAFGYSHKNVNSQKKTL